MSQESVNIRGYQSGPVGLTCLQRVMTRLTAVRLYKKRLLYILYGLKLENYVTQRLVNGIVCPISIAYFKTRLN